MFSIYAGPGWQIGLPGDTYEIILQVAAVTVLHSGGWLAVVMTDEMRGAFVLCA
jgi:NADH:ubiquinone oxidoreductase subunit H